MHPGAEDLIVSHEVIIFVAQPPGAVEYAYCTSA